MLLVTIMLRCHDNGNVVCKLHDHTQVLMLIEKYKVIGNICSHRLRLVAIGYECAMLP